MEIRQAGPGDKERWDVWVEGHPSATPYHLYAWREAVEESYGHRGRYVMALDGGRIIGVLPLIQMRNLRGSSALVSLPFCDVGGPLAESADVAAELRRQALAAGRHSGAGSVELRETSTAESTGQEPKVRMMLRLPATSGELWSSFTSKLRSQVRKAENNGLSFRWGAVNDLGRFYHVMSRNMRDLGSPVHCPAWFRSILRFFGQHGRMGLVLLGAEPVGCGIVLATGSTACIPWASTLRERNRLSPNMLLYWKFLEWAADEGFESLDFGRSTPGEGTYRFKEQWGARPRPLRWCRASLDGSWTEVNSGPSRCRKMAAAAWSRLPLKVANAVGPVLRRRISL